jgi:hypothetical protein
MEVPPTTSMADDAVMLPELLAVRAVLEDESTTIDPGLTAMEPLPLTVRAPAAVVLRTQSPQMGVELPEPRVPVGEAMEAIEVAATVYWCAPMVLRSLVAVLVISAWTLVMPEAAGHWEELVGQPLAVSV